MKITEIEVIPVAIPFSRPYVLHYGAVVPSSVIVKMETDSGLVGFGEASARPQFYGFNLKSLLFTMREILAPPLIGADPRNIRRIREIMDTSIFARGLARQAKGAFDVAAHDIAGKALGVPVSTLLGGALRDRIAVYGSSTGVGTIEETAKAAQETVAKGFANIKLKASRNPWDDVPRIAAIREAVGDNIHLRIDSNEACKTAEQAIPPLKAMEKYNLTLVEGILPRHDFHGTKKLCDALDTPVVIHQGLESPEDAANLVRFGVGDVFNIAVQNVGGLYSAMEILAIAENFGIPVLVGATRDTAIGDAASAHFASVIRNLPYACDCRYHKRYAEDVIKTPIRVEGGYTYVPQGPGLGIEVDENKIEKYRVSV